LSITVENAPRDIESIKTIPSMVRYRLALTLGIMPNDQGAIAGFAAQPIDVQAQQLLQGFQAHDQRVGAAPAMTAPQQPAPGPAPGMGGPPPGQMAPPPMMGAPGMMQQQPLPMGAPMQPQYQQPPPPPPNGAPPGQMQLPAGFAPPGGPPPMMGAPPPMGAPPGQMMPQGGPPPQMMGTPPPRTPSTASDPGGQQQPGIGGLDAVARGVGVILQQLETLKKTVDDEVPGVENVDEVFQAVLGVAATQQVVAVLLVLLLENVGQMPRPLIYQAVREEIEKDSASALLAGIKGAKTTGKG
jgi:hypothetical protein